MQSDTMMAVCEYADKQEFLFYAAWRLCGCFVLLVSQIHEMQLEHNTGGSLSAMQGFLLEKIKAMVREQ